MSTGKYKNSETIRFIGKLILGDGYGPMYAAYYARVSNILKRKYSAASFGSANVQDSSLIHFLVELEGRVEAVS